MQQLFRAELKRGDIRTAFYHMAVWNVDDAGKVIKELVDADPEKSQRSEITVAEMVRQKASRLRR